MSAEWVKINDCEHELRCGKAVIKLGRSWRDRKVWAVSVFVGGQCIGSVNELGKVREDDAAQLLRVKARAEAVALALLDEALQLIGLITEQASERAPRGALVWESIPHKQEAWRATLPGRHKGELVIQVQRTRHEHLVTRCVLLTEDGDELARQDYPSISPYAARWFVEDDLEQMVADAMRSNK